MLLVPLLALALAAPVRADDERAPITHGIAVGDVGPDSAIIWSRTDRDAVMHVWLRPSQGGVILHQQVAVAPSHDFTGRVVFRNLRPETDYQYLVRFGGDASPPRKEPVAGSFRTAPSPTKARSVRFAWGADLGGQNACRDVNEGFPMLSVLLRARWDFFLALGDMIYADQSCDAHGRFNNDQIPSDVGPAASLPAFWAHWRYTRDDPGLRDFLGRTPYFAVWDDHEVADNAGPLEDTRDVPPYHKGAHLLPLGLAALIDYNPIVPPEDSPMRLYRNARWGRHAELFLLDTRQYRDADAAEDHAERPKTMLGREQLTWLKAKLEQSDATWKFVVSSVPLAVPTGTAEKPADGWANGEGRGGFESELLDILRHLKARNLRNVIWLSADVHFAQGLRLRPFPADPGFVIHEFTSGPMHAGFFPNRALDPSLNPQRLFFHGPDDPNAVTSLQQARRWMNVGAIEIDEAGTLRVRIVNADGDVVWASEALPPS